MDAVQEQKVTLEMSGPPIVKYVTYIYGNALKVFQNRFNFPHQRDKHVY